MFHKLVKINTKFRLLVETLQNPYKVPESSSVDNIDLFSVNYLPEDFDQIENIIVDVLSSSLVRAEGDLRAIFEHLEKSLSNKVSEFYLAILADQNIGFF